MRFKYSISIYLKQIVYISHFILISFLCIAELFISGSHTRKRNAKHEDCEKAPEVDNSSVFVRYDDNEEYVTATYSCFDGYKLQGKATITCDLETDEWEENPPTCIQNGKFFFIIFSVATLFLCCHAEYVFSYVYFLHFNVKKLCYDVVEVH